MPTIRSVRLQRFKRIDDAPFDLSDVNVIVGGNNSGKSSVIQGLHFGVGLLQTIALEQSWGGGAHSSSLSPNQLIYSPSEDVYALGTNGRLMEPKEKAITLELVLDSGDQCVIRASKGRNRNVVVSVSNTEVAAKLSSLEQPFSIFSPGLAGIAKREAYVSDGVLYRALARGDANLVLRNILLRLWKKEQWYSFMNDLHDIFPHVDLKIAFNPQTDEVIDAFIQADSAWVPLEIAGTGILQTVQILSYIHRFNPSLVVLDEPDSHLHPNNQRLLCALLRKVAEERGTQIVMTTHSRHVIDALGATARFLWVRKGSIHVAGEDDEIGILLDIGALDIKERAGQSSTKAVVLTEDELTAGLELLLEANGFDVTQTAILSYYGVATTIKQLRPVVKLILSSNPKVKIVVHRDRDFLTNDEVSTWCKDVRALGAEPFVTRGRDIESYFLSTEHLSEANPSVTAQSFEELMAKVLTDSRDQLVADFVNGRMDAARKAGLAGSANAGQIAVEAAKRIDEDALAYAGKKILRSLRREYREKHGSNLQSHVRSTRLVDEDLSVIAKKAFPKQGKNGTP